MSLHTCILTYMHTLGTRIRNIEIKSEGVLILLTSAPFHRKLPIFRKITFMLLRQPRPRSNFEKTALAPHDFAGSFYLI